MQIKSYIVEYCTLDLAIGADSELRTIKSGPITRKVLAYTSADAVVQVEVQIKRTCHDVIIMNVSPDFTAAADNSDSTAQR